MNIFYELFKNEIVKDLYTKLLERFDIEKEEKEVKENDEYSKICGNFYHRNISFIISFFCLPIQIAKSYYRTTKEPDRSIADRDKNERRNNKKRQGDYD